MHKLRAEFDGNGTHRIVQRKRTSADPVACLQSKNRNPGAVQFAQSHQARRSSANHNHVHMGIRHIASVAESHLFTHGAF